MTQDLPSSAEHPPSTTRLSQVQSRSLQSHLSSINSQQRIRASCSQPTYHTESLHVLTVAPKPHSSTSSIFSGLAFPSIYNADNSGQRGRATVRGCLKWALFVYSGLCAIYFTLRLPQEIRSYKSDSIQTAVDGPTSPLDSLSISHRFSRLTSIHSQIQAFHPNVVRSNTDSASPTACLWTRNADPSYLYAWASHWQGPISLVLITTTPHSPEIAELVTNISTTDTGISMNTPISLHLVIVDDNVQDTPNAFLNLARLYSATARVVLFPDDLSLSPSISASSIPPSPNIMLFSKESPRTLFPFVSSAPVLLDRDHTLWCTERFVSGSRTLDWEECLWQVWLETFGKIHVQEQLSDHQAMHEKPSPLTVKIHNKLSGKFRMETCILAAKQLVALDPSARESPKGTWLKAACPESGAELVPALEASTDEPLISNNPRNRGTQRIELRDHQRHLTRLQQCLRLWLRGPGQRR